MRTKSPDTMNKIKEYVERYYFEHKTSPSIREIAGGIGIGKTTVFRYLQDMSENGMVTYDGESIATEKTNKLVISTVSIPIVGRITCGTPNLAEENIEEYISLPKSMFGEGKHFILRASGNSMIDIGIASGDLVVIKQATCAENGQVVSALVDNEATLKRYYKENGHIRLHPENSSMEDIIVDDCIIQGIAVKVFKDIT